MLTVLLALLAATSQAQTFQVLYNFTDSYDGADPNGLAINRAGELFGTTKGPGYCFGNNGACGAVFELSRSGSSWSLSSLYHFHGGSDGSWPTSGVTVAPDGSLYGTTASGGNGGSCDYGDTPGCGTVYHLRPPAHVCSTLSCPWTNTVIYAFHGYSDLQTPFAEVTFDAAGNIYGTAIFGGSYIYGGGVYKLTPSQNSWSYDFLYNFHGSPDGSTPYDSVMFDQVGNMYGTTSSGGTDQNGVIFKMTPSGSGWSETIPYTFGKIPDGGYPVAGLISDSAGNLYGTTAGGGQSGNGTVFELSPVNGSYVYSVLYDGFYSPYGPDNGPQAKLAMDQAGNLYGTSYGTGTNLMGQIFRLSHGANGWTFSVLHEFNDNDGAFPIGNLVIDTSGNIYGTTTQGGAKGEGVIWELTP